MYFRAFYSSPLSDGCIEAEASSGAEFRAKVRYYLIDMFGDDANEVHIDRWHQFNPIVCRECGQTLGNLGLIYDECVNDACGLYLKDQR